jgi:DNA polymerase-3 subunit gamma/tau
MSYEVLARRWRPQTFDEVAGQAHVTTALRNAIRLERVPHAVLLTGPRGVGKTSIARILARSLNCDEGPTEKPCGKCSPCTEIAVGTSLDVQEIDAASHTGVENVRDIRESIRFAAAPGKHRIFIIDEVHMLSGAAFNALLKTLEEPPPSSLFVFATTDPQKIPSTVLSRVQRFDLKRIGSKQIFERLIEIIRKEELEIPETIVRAIVREADGSLRDAQTLLDRLTAALGSTISERDAETVLELVDRRIVRGILDPILAGDPASALDALRRGFERGIEPARLAGELLQEIRDLLVARLAGDAEGLVEATPEELAEIRERAREHDPETFQRLFRVLLQRQQDLAWAPRPEHALEMAVVRLATLPTAESLAELVQRLAGLDPEGSLPRGGGEGSGRPRASSARPAAAEPTRPAQRDPERVAKLKAEAKSHPAVLETIEALDAEIKEIRLRERSD